MKIKFAVYQKGFDYPMFIFDKEEDAKQCWLNHSLSSANWYYETIWVKE